MKKALLLIVAALLSLTGSSNNGDGLVLVGGSIILLPSSRWDTDVEWKAMTWVYNTGMDYGAWNSWNKNYNQYIYEPWEDANGLQWYEPGFDTSPKEDDLNFDRTDEEDNPTPILWEEHRAPFSSDEYYNGSKWKSYPWAMKDEENLWSWSIISDIYVRRTFTIDPEYDLSGPVFLACGHDDAPCEYYINGELVFSRTGFEGEDPEHEVKDKDGNVIEIVTAYADGWNNDQYIQLDEDQKALLNLNGEENVIAFHVHQNWGGAFADCGLYTKMAGLPMGYEEPWEGKVLFNNFGGYNWDMKEPSNNPRHPWSKLYEAQPGDVYSFTIPVSSDPDSIWKEQLHFKTPIKIREDHDYKFQVRLKTDKTFESFVVKLTDNDDDDIELAYEEMRLEAPAEEEQEEYEGTLIEIPFSGWDVNNFKIAFDFGGGEDSTNVVISDISLLDLGGEEPEETELWVGTHYFNFIDMTKPVTKYRIWDETIKDKDGNEVGGWREPKNDEEKEYADEYIECDAVDAPEISGRVETLAWTLPDFDDSMWDDQMMPVSDTYPNLYWDIEPQSKWPGGDNTNYWIRRNFELEEINPSVSYELNVCHDDVYETYVNGQLLQKNTHWTDGKHPVQVHIPARYLNVGKNVIATYIQQNWGGRFYDCGINVTKVDYQDCLKQFNDALAYCQTDTLLTNAMKDSIQSIIAEAQKFYNENKNDPAELRNYAKTLAPKANAIFKYSPNVKVLKDTWDICRKMEDKGYWGTTLNDAVAALDTCIAPSQWEGVLTRLREARKATVMERHTENFVGCVPETVTEDEIGDFDDFNPKYYIYNVGAKNFLGGGEAYGTHLALEYVSNPMMLIQATREIVEDGEPTGDIEDIPGAYRIESFRPNGDRGTADFVSFNGFIDVPCNDAWELIPVEGKPNVYNIAQYGNVFGVDVDTIVVAEGDTIFEETPRKKYLGLRSGDNQYTPSHYIVDTDMHTPELETNQWMFITKEEMQGFLTTATEENPADFSFFINNPNYDAHMPIEVWSNWGGQVLNRVFESWNSKEAHVAQDFFIEDPEEAQQIPAGTYKLTVQGFYRDGSESAHIQKVANHQPVALRATIFVGPFGFDDPETCETIPLMAIHAEANKFPGIGVYLKGLRMPGTADSSQFDRDGQKAATAQAEEDYFPSGLYKNEIVFNIPEGYEGCLAFGIDKELDESLAGKGDWIVVDNWRLKYYGKDVQNPDAIKGVTSDEIDNNVVSLGKGIYNLLGQRLSKTQKGVNIINGKKVLKK